MEQEFEIIEKVIKSTPVNPNSCVGCCFEGEGSVGSISPLDPCRLCGDHIFVKIIELKELVG